MMRCTKLLAPCYFLKGQVGWTHPRHLAALRYDNIGGPELQQDGDEEGAAAAAVPAKATVGGKDLGLSAIKYMSVKELKAQLDEKGVDHSQCIEKQELVELLRLYWGVVVQKPKGAGRGSKSKGRNAAAAPKRGAAAKGISKKETKKKKQTKTKQSAAGTATVAAEAEVEQQQEEEEEGQPAAAPAPARAKKVSKKAAAAAARVEAEAAAAAAEAAAQQEQQEHEQEVSTQSHPITT